MKKSILITIDLEEFDLPNDFGSPISDKQKYEISKQGVESLLDLLAALKIPATFFTTAHFALKYPSIMKQIARTHEVAFHGYAHEDVYASMSAQRIQSRLSDGKKKIEDITGKKMTGFRAQRLQSVNPAILQEAGLTYDSSLHPTYIPGRYNHLLSSRKIQKNGSVTEIPLSVTPLLRMPLFWLAFRNFGLPYARFCTRWIMAYSDYTMLLFHPWEFVNLSPYKLNIPGYVQRNTGGKLRDMLYVYAVWCRRRGYEFKTVRQFLFPHKRNIS